MDSQGEKDEGKYEKLVAYQSCTERKTSGTAQKAYGGEGEKCGGILACIT